MGSSGREEWQEMEFLSCSVSDQLDFSTEELGDTHTPVPSAEEDPVLPKLLLHPALAHNAINTTEKANYQRWKLSCLPGNSGQGRSILSGCCVSRTLKRKKNRLRLNLITCSLCDSYCNWKKAKACYRKRLQLPDYRKRVIQPERWMVAGILTYHCQIT